MKRNFKKILMTAVLVLIVDLLFVTVTLAKGPDGHAGKSNIGLLYLSQKNPETWEIVTDGALGKVTYRLPSPMFKLNYILGRFFVGINARLKITEDFRDWDYNYTNWGIGGQIGITF